MVTRYVALGSSFAAGPGIAPQVSAAARRSARNYAHQVAARLPAQLADATVSGATTATILTETQQTRRGPVPPQIGAVTADTDLVTVTAGGNDVGYIGSLMRGSTDGFLAGKLGLLPGVPGRLRGRVSFRVEPAGFDAVTAGLVRIADEVRSRAPHARVVFVDYLTLLGPDAAPGPGLPLTPDQIGRARELGLSLDAAFARAAVQSGAALVRASQASTGHGLGSAEPWVTGFTLRPPPRMRRAGGAAPFHPNLAGMTAVADLVLAALRAEARPGQPA